MIHTLGQLCMRALKNLCDGSCAKIKGNKSPYCYLLQFAKVISIAINKNRCFCDVL